MMSKVNYEKKHIDMDDSFMLHSGVQSGGYRAEQ